MEKAKNPRQIRGDRKNKEKEGERQIHGVDSPNARHNPAVSSASMDFKRSP